MSRVLVIDHGSGNLRSVCRALEAAGAEVTLGSSSVDAAAADALVLPGVGAFAACMDRLRAMGGDDLVREHLLRERPVLGICVGHQMLFEGSVEHGVPTPGLGIWPGQVVELPVKRLPHMGWNVVEAPEGSPLFTGIEREHFYFVHGYGVLEPGTLPGDVAVTRHEGVPIVAAVSEGLVCGAQFHPEKSGGAGREFLVNWLSESRSRMTAA